MPRQIETITKREFFQLISDRYSVPFARGVTMSVPGAYTPLNDQRILYRTAKSIKPKVILEIGTFDGSITLGLYLNAFGAEVYTIDICKEMGIDVPHMQLCDVLPKKLVGRVFGKKVPGIYQFFGDSRDKKSYSFLKGKTIDFVFIDGNHSCDAVIKDTCNVLKFTKKNSIIFWHDFLCERNTDVHEALGKLIYTKKLQIYHIAKTILAFAIL